MEPLEHYVSRASQTDIQGLCNDPASRPLPLVTSRSHSHSPQAQTLTTITGTPTPPDDDMAHDKSHFALPRPLPDQHQHQHLPAQPFHHHHTPTMNMNLQPNMFLRRKSRPSLARRISLPNPDLSDDVPRSPPPTEALMSPLPAANTLHAGHTPIIPRALSPLPHSSGPASPAGDDALTGPLTLPPQPGDAADDTIPLHVLDQELEKLRIAQERERDPDDASDRSDSAEPEAAPAHEDDAAMLLLRERAAKPSRKTPPDDFVDGVLLKKPRMNLGAPLGQA